MIVFISWSGERSQALAAALRDWLPNVIQAIKPWMSDVDIDKGSRWSMDIAFQLNESKVGIICLTPENLEAPWILFEAGALSKTLEKPNVCPYLFQVEPADVKGPLVQFQATKAKKDDTRKLMSTINQALKDTALSERQLDEAFEVWWPKLEDHLKKIPDIQMKRKPMRSEREIIEEILELTREQTRIVKSYDEKNFRSSRLREYYMPPNELGAVLETFGKVIRQAKREKKELVSEEDKDDTAE